MTTPPDATEPMPAWAKDLKESVDYAILRIADIETHIRDVNAQLQAIGNVNDFGHPRSDDDEWVDLPAEGRDGPAPEWPFPHPPTDQKRELWEDQWKRPQAVEWERAHQERDVAFHVRYLCEEETAPASVIRHDVLSTLQYDLGLSPVGLVHRRWRISHAPSGICPQFPPSTSTTTLPPPRETA